jgi:hypothetical protein
MSFYTNLRSKVLTLNRFSFRAYSADDYEDFPEVPPLLRLSFNLPEDEYFKTPGKRYRKFGMNFFSEQNQMFNNVCFFA